MEKQNSLVKFAINQNAACDVPQGWKFKLLKNRVSKEYNVSSDCVEFPVYCQLVVMGAYSRQM
jgi:hypothetical protein